MAGKKPNPSGIGADSPNVFPLPTVANKILGRVCNNVWLVALNEFSTQQLATEHRVFYFYVEWFPGTRRFQIWFSHVTRRSSDDPRNSGREFILPVYLTEPMKSWMRAQVMCAFLEDLFSPQIESISVRTTTVSADVFGESNQRRRDGKPQIQLPDDRPGTDVDPDSELGQQYAKMMADVAADEERARKQQELEEEIDE